MNEPNKYLVGKINITLSYTGLWEMKVKELLGTTTTLTHERPNSWDANH